MQKLNESCSHPIGVPITQAAVLGYGYGEDNQPNHLMREELEGKGFCSACITKWFSREKVS